MQILYCTGPRLPRKLGPTIAPDPVHTRTPNEEIGQEPCRPDKSDTSCLHLTSRISYSRGPKALASPRAGGATVRCMRLVGRHAHFYWATGPPSISSAATVIEFVPETIFRTAPLLALHMPVETSKSALPEDPRALNSSSFPAGTRNSAIVSPCDLSTKTFATFEERPSRASAAKARLEATTASATTYFHFIISFVEFTPKTANGLRVTANDDALVLRASGSGMTGGRKPESPAAKR